MKNKRLNQLEGKMRYIQSLLDDIKDEILKEKLVADKYVTDPTTFVFSPHIPSLDCIYEDSNGNWCKGKVVGYSLGTQNPYKVAYSPKHRWAKHIRVLGDVYKEYLDKYIKEDWPREKLFLDRGGAVLSKSCPHNMTSFFSSGTSIVG